MRLVGKHIARDEMQLVHRNVWRVAENDVKLLVQLLELFSVCVALSEVAEVLHVVLDELCAIRQAMEVRILLSYLERLARDVEPNTRRQWELRQCRQQQTPRACANIKNPESAVLWILFHERLEEHFTVASWDECAGGDFEIQGPKLFLAQDIRQRLATAAAIDKRGQRLRLLCVQLRQEQYRESESFSFES